MDINVNVKMYSIAVAVNLYHSGTQNVALVRILFLLNHARETRVVIAEQRYWLSFRVQGMNYSKMFETQQRQVKS